MEMEAAPAAKKNRTMGEAPEQQDKDPTESESPHESNGRGGIDRISGLPDEILGEIISLLATKDGARTQSLASRWRHLWLSAPLNVDRMGLPRNEQVQVGIISRILASHPGPARRFSVYTWSSPETAVGWLQSTALRNLQELDFLLLSVKTSPPLPASAFPFSATLRVATIKECHLPDDVVETLHFPQLKQLKLGSVKISDGALHSLIAGGCPVLECLLLDGGYCIRINSPNITSIGMGSGELIIEDAPSLVRLILLDPDVRLNVISAPRLETLGCYSDGDHNTNMVFGTLAIQKLCAVTLMTGVPSIKVLAIHMHDLSLDTVINLMRCFPCLEKLYVKSDISRNRNSWRRKHHNLIRSLDVRLKTVVLKHYRGTQSQVNFASFFVLNAKLLELMRFEGEIQDDDHISITKQQMLLQLEKRASVGMQVSFTARCRYVHKLSHIKNVRDLSTTNPFECTC